MLALYFCLLLFGVSVEVRSEEASSFCYDGVGCFDIGYPFVSKNWPLTFPPQSPDTILTRFLLFTRESRYQPQVLDARYPNLFASSWTNFKVRSTKILIHGFLDTIETKPVWKELVDELIKNDNHNVIFVDWSGGNQLPYTQATANTRVVGAQIAELVKALTKSLTLNLSDVHIIGHSLGAQTAGYAGERLPGLGRITGLDPAGPYFEDADKRVRLDETDAQFVDIVHSNAEPLIKFGFGTRTVSGHIDFYPNLGHYQPGCDKNPIPSFLNNDLLAAMDDTLFCNHVRSLRFFNESINSACPFLSYPCDSEDRFANNLCHSCGALGCQRMGFRAKKVESPTGQPLKYFLTTGDKPPFCRYHYAVILKLSESGTAQRGKLYVNINGDSFMLNQFALNSDPQVFQPGQSYTFFLLVPRSFGNVLSVSISWKSVPVSLWDFLSQSNQSLLLDDIHVYWEEAGSDAHFCLEGKSVQSGGNLFASKKC